jgi:hypothetical protein
MDVARTTVHGLAAAVLATAMVFPQMLVAKVH